MTKKQLSDIVKSEYLKLKLREISKAIKEAYQETNLNGGWRLQCDVDGSWPSPEMRIVAALVDEEDEVFSKDCVIIRGFPDRAIIAGDLVAIYEVMVEEAHEKFSGQAEPGDSPT